MRPAHAALADRTHVRYTVRVGSPHLLHLATTADRLIPVRERCLPVDEVLASLLPDGGLARGRTVGCSGPAAWSLAFALVARAVTSGSWVAAVGVPTLGIEAASELGVPLGRLVVVDTDASPATWAERVAAAADGFDLVMTHPPTGAERVARRVRQRIQARGGVLVAVGTASPGLSCDIEVGTTAVEWVGLGHGAGRLTGRRATIRVAGRRAPRPVEREVLLPGPAGRIADLEQERSEHVPPADESDVELDRAG
jgi:hypothetical protein